MTSIQSITLARANEIEADSITSATVASGRLVLTSAGGTVVDGGPVGVPDMGEVLSNPALVTVSAFDIPSYDALVPEWYSPGKSPTRLADPATQTASIPLAANWSPCGRYLAVCHATTPFITIYKRVGDVLTKLTDPATLPPASGTGVSWTSDGQYLAVSTTSTPFLFIYKRAGDVFTKLTDPAALPPGSGQSVCWSPDGVYLSVGSSSSPYLVIYKRAGDVLTKLTNPATMPAAGPVIKSSWTSNGTYLAVGINSNTTIELIIYKRSGDVFTKLSDPAIMPSGSGVYSVAWSPDDQYLAVACTSSGNLIIYKRAGDVLTKLTVAIAVPSPLMTGLTWSPDGRYLIGFQGSTGVGLYERSGDVFLPLRFFVSVGATFSATSDAIAFTPDGKYLAVGAASPYVRTYKSLGFPPPGTPTRITPIP